MSRTAHPPATAAGTPPAAPAGDHHHRPSPIDTAEESVAGEEDPGASLDLPAEPSSTVPGAAGAGKSKGKAEGTGTAAGRAGTRERGPGR